MLSTVFENDKVVSSTQKNFRGLDTVDLIQLSYCSFVCIGVLFLTIARQAKRSGVYLTL